jgi:uncharacterized membrane protein HdeD (DUF308 family)
MLLTMLPVFNIHIPVTPLLLFVFLALLLSAWGIFSVVVRYHWRQYGTSKLEILSMTFFYLAGSAVLLGLTTASAFLYYASAT